MDSILNYSENDFPSLGSSVGGKSRKRHQIQSPVAHQNTAENKLTGQPAPRGYNEETTAVCSASGSSSQCQQKLSDTRRPKPTTSVTLGDFLMVVFIYCQRKNGFCCCKKIAQIRSIFCFFFWNFQTFLIEYPSLFKYLTSIEPLGMLITVTVSFKLDFQNTYFRYSSRFCENI